MYYSAIGMLAILILLIENQDIFFRFQDALKNSAWKVYRRFLLAVLVYYVTDVLWGLFELGKLPRLLFADSTAYFMAMSVSVLFWIRYAVAYLDKKNGFGRLLIQAGYTLAVLISLFAAVNIFIPVLFTVDSDCVYRGLPLRYGILAAQILLFFLISGHAFSVLLRSDPEKRAAYRTLALFGLEMGVFLFIQLWFPLLPLYSIGYMLGTSLLHSFVAENEMADYRRDLKEASRVKELKDIIASLLDHMPGMTFTKDAKTGTYLACNRAFAAYARKQSPEEVVGLTDAELFEPELAELFLKDSRIALSMDEPYIFYEDLADAQGNMRQYQTTEIKYTDAAGRLCLLGLIQDVTDMVRIRRENAASKEAYEKARSSGLMYSHIAQSMARGFMELYYVNIDTEEYIEYRPDEDGTTLVEKRRGWHFFEQCQLEAQESVYPEDCAAVIKALDRKTLVAAVDRSKTFVMTYRLKTESGPSYVSMRVSRMEDDERYLILGVTDVDEQVKHRRAEERMREERIAYARLSALSGDYLCIYVVVPETGRYREFTASTEFESVARLKEGMDFFTDTREQSRTSVYPDDLNRFFTSVTQENVMDEVGKHGIFTLSYRLLIEGKPHYVQLKAAMVEEEGGQRLIVGVFDIDTQVRQEEEHVRNLAQARIEANVDALTGVKNRHAYLLAEERLNLQIEENRAQDFAIVILDVNDLKKVNDTEGHQAGDQYLCGACKIICDIFKRSPVFRIGGDEFAVIAQGSDYASIEELVGRVRDHNMEAQRSGGIVIACGMARSEKDESTAPVFERADQNMYENKCELKAAGKERL